MVSLAWEACGDVDCATLAVPLDRFGAQIQATGRIPLRAYRQLSTAADSRHLPLVIHAGGPGTDVRAAVSRAREVLGPLADDFDLYALSTRGTVDGRGFDCGQRLDDLRKIDADSQAARRFASECLELSSELVGRMGTRQSVEDLETFRGVLGVDHVRFLGWSYGATLGAAWAMTHPSSILSMVLDAPSDPLVSWPDELRLRYAAATEVFARSSVSTLLDAAGNARERALAREYVMYEPSTSATGKELVSLRLGETTDGYNDGGIETQIGVHCSDITRAEARAAIEVIEPEPEIGFGATFDRICIELAESRTPLTEIHVDLDAGRVPTMVVSTTGDHVVPAVVSQNLARTMSWENLTVDAVRHLAVGFDGAATKTAMTFLAAGE